MTMRFCAALALFLASASTLAQVPPDLDRILTFETAQAGGVLTGWSTTPVNSAVADGTVVRTGVWSARLERPLAGSGDFSGLSKSIPLEVAGKTIVLRGFLKTDNVTGFVSLWIREDGSGTTNLAFASTQDRGVKGTNDWQEHRVTLPIHADARQLAFGVLISGSGTVWIDDLELTVDGAPFLSAPKADRPKTIIETDYEFSAGSKVAVGRGDGPPHNEDRCHHRAGRLQL